MFIRLSSLLFLHLFMYCMPPLIVVFLVGPFCPFHFPRIYDTFSAAGLTHVFVMLLVLCVSYCFVVACVCACVLLLLLSCVSVPVLFFMC